MKLVKGRIAPRLALVSLLALAPTFAVPASAAGPVEGTVTGQLTVGTTTTPLAHVYARVDRGLTCRPDGCLVVFLSDVPLPAEEFLEQFPGYRLAAKMKAHVLTVKFTPKGEKRPGAILHEAFVSSDSFQDSGESVFRAKTFDGKVIEGTLTADNPAEPKTPEFDGVVRRQYTASFRVSLWQRPAPTLTGAAAAQSPQGKAALAFLEALNSGDKAAAKKAMTPDAEAAKALDGPQAADVLKMLGSINPKPAAAKVESVTVLGNGAEVTVTGPKTADDATSHTIFLSLVNGQWLASGETTEPWW